MVFTACFSPNFLSISFINCRILGFVAMFSFSSAISTAICLRSKQHDNYLFFIGFLYIFFYYLYNPSIKTFGVFAYHMSSLASPNFLLPPNGSLGKYIILHLYFCFLNILLPSTGILDIFLNNCLAYFLLSFSFHIFNCYQLTI